MSAPAEHELERQRRRKIMRGFTISMLSAVDRPAQEGARAVILKCAPGPAPAEPILPDREAGVEERERARVHNLRSRDQHERAAAARERGPTMTLRDCDDALECMARDAARTSDRGESTAQAYDRLLRERHPKFLELLQERERVEREGP